MKTKLTLITVLTILIFNFSVIRSEETIVSGTGSVTGNILINGSIAPLMISISHPVSVTYSIDPNNGINGSFIAPEISVTNNTKVPVKVTLNSLSSAPGGTLTFTDVNYDSKQWTSLNKADSKKYIALGIKALQGTGWNEGADTDINWASGLTATSIGTINSYVSARMLLVAYFGLAFDSAYTANHRVEFKFELN